GCGRVGRPYKVGRSLRERRPTRGASRLHSAADYEPCPTREIDAMNPTRRTFLGASAALAAGAALAADKPASEKLVVALIGCGGQGRGDLRAFLRLPEIEVAALCDVDRAHVDTAA